MKWVQNLIRARLTIRHHCPLKLSNLLVVSFAFGYEWRYSRVSLPGTKSTDFFAFTSKIYPKPSIWDFPLSRTNFWWLVDKLPSLSRTFIRSWWQKLVLFSFKNFAWIMEGVILLFAWFDEELDSTVFSYVPLTLREEIFAEFTLVSTVKNFRISQPRNIIFFSLI